MVKLILEGSLEAELVEELQVGRYKISIPCTVSSSP